MSGDCKAISSGTEVKRDCEETFGGCLDRYRPKSMSHARFCSLVHCVWRRIHESLLATGRRLALGRYASFFFHEIFAGVVKGARKDFHGRIARHSPLERRGGPSVMVTTSGVNTVVLSFLLRVDSRGRVGSAGKVGLESSFQFTTYRNKHQVEVTTRTELTLLLLVKA